MGRRVCVFVLSCLCVLLAHGYDFPKEELDLGELTTWSVPEYDQGTNAPADIGKESCSICGSAYSDADAPPEDAGVPVRLPCCKNLFHSRCLQQAFAITGKGSVLTCPLCSRQYGIKMGGQPKAATMMVNDETARVSVYMNFAATSDRKREIKYFSVGRDWKGYQIKHQLQILFLRKNLFKVGFSQARNKNNVIIPQGSLHLKHFSGERYDSILEELKVAKAIQIAPQPEGTVEQCKSKDGQWIEFKFIFERPSGTVTKTVVLPSTLPDIAHKLIGAFTHKVLFFIGASVESNEAVVSPFEFELPTDKSISKKASLDLLKSRAEYFAELNEGTVDDTHRKRDTETSLSMRFPVTDDKLDNLKRLNRELTDVLKGKRLPVWSFDALPTCAAVHPLDTPVVLTPVVHTPVVLTPVVHTPVVHTPEGGVGVRIEAEEDADDEEEVAVVAPKAPEVVKKASTGGILTINMIGKDHCTLDLTLESGELFHAVLPNEDSNRRVLVPLIINAFKTGKLFGSESTPVLFHRAVKVSSSSECAAAIALLQSRGARAGRHDFGKAIFSTVSSKGQPNANLLETKKAFASTVVLEFRFPGWEEVKVKRAISDGLTESAKKLSQDARHLLRTAFVQQLLFRVDSKLNKPVCTVNLSATDAELVAALRSLLEENREV